MKKTLLVCDSCGNEIDAQGGTMRFNYSDARKGTKAADLCGGCAGDLPGRSVARRGRPSKAAVAA